MDIHLHMILYVLSFLTGRQQAVRVNGQHNHVHWSTPRFSHLFTFYPDHCRSLELEMPFIKYSVLLNTVVLDRTISEGWLWAALADSLELCRK